MSKKTIVVIVGVLVGLVGIGFLISILYQTPSNSLNDPPKQTTAQDPSKSQKKASEKRQRSYEKLYQKDAVAFYGIFKVYEENLGKATETQQKADLKLWYLNQVYELANRRVSKELERLYIHDKGYIDYIGMLQTYCRYYQRDAQTISKHITDPQFNMKKSAVFITLWQLEDFWGAQIPETTK